MIRDLKTAAWPAVHQRYKEYWNHTGTMPLLRIHGLSVHKVDDEPAAPQPEPQPYEAPELIDRAAFRAQTEDSYDRHGMMADDFIRGISPQLHTEVLVECPVLQGVSNWAEPCVTAWNQLDDYVVEQTIWYQRLIENTRRSLEAIDPETYPFNCLGIRGPVDMARGMLGAEVLCAAVYDHPQELKDLLERITDIIIATEQAHSRMLPLYEGGQFNHEGVWGPGLNAAFSVDAAWIFSPATYEEFFLPCDARFCDAFDSTVLHLHSASQHLFHLWAQVPKLALQCSVDELRLSTGERKPLGLPFDKLFPRFQVICQHTTLMIDGYWEQELIDRTIAELPAGRFSIRGGVPDVQALRDRYVPAAQHA